MTGMDRIARKTPQSMDEVVSEFIREAKLAYGFNVQCILSAWDKVSGAGKYTLNKFFKDGVLFVTLSSSVVRSNLYFQTDAIKDAINALVQSDPLFVKDDPRTSSVKKIVLK